MARGFSLFEEALLVFEVQDSNVERYMKVQQPFRMQSSATVSSMMRKKELLSRHHWIIFFKRVDRIESSKEPEPVPSTSGVSEIAACSPSPIADDPSALHLPPCLPPPVSNSSCMFT